MAPDVLAIAALVASSSGLISAVSTFLLRVRAQRALVKELNKRHEVVSALLLLQTELATESPDPEAIAHARQLILEAASGLGERERKDIVSTLDAGSDRSKANYITKFILDASRTEA